MKHLTLITVCLIISSGCYTAKKCQEKFCKTDTITVTFHDTIRTETVKTDTIFHNSVDSVTIIKDRLKIVYKRLHDSIYINGECAGDTIYISKEIKVPVKNPVLTNWQAIKQVRFWVLLIFLAGVLLGIYIKINR